MTADRPNAADYGDAFHPLNGSWLPIVAIARLRAIEEAAREVCRLGNQPGLDDEEWEAAFTALEEALR